MELKALNVIKSLVISSTINETGSNLGWVFCWVILGGFTQKNPAVIHTCYSGESKMWELVNTCK